MYAFSQSRSLRTRLVLGVLVATIASLWAVALTIGHYLRRDIEAAISAQQFSTVALIASDLDRSIRERTAILSAASDYIADRGLLAKPTIASYLDAQTNLLPLFNWGITIADAHGVALASIPKESGRVGVNYGDLPFFKQVVSTGAVQITNPMIGRRTGVPVSTIAVPVKNRLGQVTGVVMGITNLERPNFLDEISMAKYGRTGDFLLTDPKTRIFVASSDKRRVMQAGPPRGVNPVFDRYIDGFEGSGIAMSSRGVEELSSSKIIPSSGWLMQSVLPTQEAFAPVREMQRHLFVISTLLTLFAGGIAWWWLHRQLMPLREASRILGEMREGTIEQRALPVFRNDEIGDLVIAFNSLLEVIARHEALAAEVSANLRLSKILAQVPGMVFQYRRHADGSGEFPFASDAVQALYEVSADELKNSANLIRAMVNPADMDTYLGSMRESAETLTPWKLDYRIRVPSGVEKWV